MEVPAPICRVDFDSTYQAPCSFSKGVEHHTKFQEMLFKFKNAVSDLAESSMKISTAVIYLADQYKRKC